MRPAAFRRRPDCSYRICRDRLSGTAGALQQGVQAGAHRILQKVQPLPDDGAVSPTSGMTSATVPSAASSPYISKARQGRSPSSAAKLKGNARTAQILKRAFIIGPLGVHHGNGIGQRVAPGRWWSVMIRSSPSSLAQAASSTAEMPLSTVTTSLKPFCASDWKRSAGQAVAGTARGQLAAHMRPDW